MKQLPPKLRRLRPLVMYRMFKAPLRPTRRAKLFAPRAVAPPAGPFDALFGFGAVLAYNRRR